MKVSDGNVNLESNKKIVTEKVDACSNAGLLLQDDGGNYIKINDGGIVDISKQSCVNVYLGADHSITHATRTKVRLNTEVFDLHGEFDNSTNYRFTATKAGYYVVIGQCCIGSLADADRLYSSIYKNDSIVADSRLFTGGATSPRNTVGIILHLAVNDYIDLRVYHNYGSNRDIKAGINNSFLTIHKLS
jgi:hypothetical protein